jgi:hypothetical protein
VVEPRRRRVEAPPEGGVASKGKAEGVDALLQEEAGHLVIRGRAVKK